MTSPCIAALAALATVALAPPPSAPPATEAPSPQVSPVAAPPAAPAALTPNALYDAAYDRWKALPRPPYTTYQASFLALFQGKVRERRYKVAFRDRDRTCLVTGVPLDERDHVDPPQVTDKCFGPDFAFTFVAQKGGGGGALPVDIPSAEPSASASGEPRVIGSVSVRARPYELTDAGTETIDGIRAVHLALRPYRDPNHNVLRDLWIDPSDDAVVQLRGDAGLGLARVTFTVDYATRDGAGERFERLTGYGKAQLLLVKVGADVHFEQTSYAFPASLPDAVFDARIRHDAGSAPPTALP